MTTYFVTRHQGAIDWAALNGIRARQISHFDHEILNVGDQVLGTLPVNLAAIVCSKGAEYWHLVLDIPPDRRGEELSAEALLEFGAKLQRFAVEEIAS